MELSLGADPLIKRCCTAFKAHLPVLWSAMVAGGEGEVQSDAAQVRWYFVDELKHAGGILVSAIFGRHGGLYSTSDVDAFHRFCCWSSVLLRRQVVRPRWLGGAQWRRFFAGRGHSSNLPLFLGGYILRTPTTCGGGTRGHDCLIFRYHVLYGKFS
jgi:hypothetical protein